MYYVYRLQSRTFPNEKYTGFTTNVHKRLEAHNHGQVLYTAKYKPWDLVNYFAFNSEQKARMFEKYLKSGSGRAFTQKHF